MLTDLRPPPAVALTTSLTSVNRTATRLLVCPVANLLKRTDPAETHICVRRMPVGPSVYLSVYSRQNQEEKGLPTSRCPRLSVPTPLFLSV